MVESEFELTGLASPKAILLAVGMLGRSVGGFSVESNHGLKFQRLRLG
jgi:hypothetical protein